MSLKKRCFMKDMNRKLNQRDELNRKLNQRKCFMKDKKKG